MNSYEVCACLLHNPYIELNKKKEDFIEHLAGEYSYEVLGGLHILLTKQELSKDRPGNEIIMTFSLSNTVQ